MKHVILECQEIEIVCLRDFVIWYALINLIVCSRIESVRVRRVLKPYNGQRLRGCDDTAALVS